MRVLWASAHTDYAGYGWHLAQAFGKHSDIRYRATARYRNRSLLYPSDLPWPEARREWKRADVVHLLDDFNAQVSLRAPDRPFVIRYAGSAFRSDPHKALKAMRAKNAVGLVATLDLWLEAPDELEWTPFIRDLDHLASMRRPIDDGKVRIAHSPTRREIKSTDAFLAACERVSRDVEIEVILVENKPWNECLRFKSSADIYFDQVKLGYGNNAVEAWAMGIPVIAGASPETLAEMERRFPLPFYQATEDTIYYALLDLVSSQVKRDYWARVGREHAQRFHSEQAVVTQLEAIYRRLA